MSPLSSLLHYIKPHFHILQNITHFLRYSNKANDILIIGKKELVSHHLVCSIKMYSIKLFVKVDVLLHTHDANVLSYISIFITL